SAFTIGQNRSPLKAGTRHKNLNRLAGVASSERSRAWPRVRPLKDQAQGVTFMIKRFAGTTPTRSRAVAHNGIVYAVATAKNKSAPLYEQTKDALAQIDNTLGEAGSNKPRTLRAIVYITDMSRKPEMDRAWDEWVD